MLTARGANLNMMVNNGHKAVYWAAIRDRLSILKFLISQKAVYEVADMKGFTCLDHAIVNGNYETAKFLYESGLRIKSLDFYNLESERYFEHYIDFPHFIQSLESGAETCENIWLV